MEYNWGCFEATVLLGLGVGEPSQMLIDLATAVDRLSEDDE